MGMVREVECLCVCEFVSECVWGVVWELASVDSGRAWHSACQTLCVCVCVCLCVCVCEYILYVCVCVLLEDRTGLLVCLPPCSAQESAL